MARKSAANPQITADTRILALHGPEHLLRQTYLCKLREALEAEHGEIDPFRIEGKTAELAEVFDELRCYSLMQQYKLVIVDDADDFVKRHRAAMERYAEQPVDHATLVLRCDKWHKGNLDKKIAKVGAVIKCDAPTAAQAERWLVKRAEAEHGRKLEPRAAKVLVDQLGTSLGRLDSELGKLAVMAEADQPITVKLVEQLVGKANDEEVWVIQQAVLEAMAAGKPADAIEKLHELNDPQGRMDVPLAYAVSDLMRKFALAEPMRRAGDTPDTITRRLKIWPPPRARLFAQVLNRSGNADHARRFDRVVRQTAGVREGRGQTMRILECFLAAPADA